LPESASRVCECSGFLNGLLPFKSGILFPKSNSSRGKHLLQKQNATTNKTTLENQKEGKTIMTFRKIAAPVLILSSIVLGATAANAGVYNPANDSSPDAMTPGYTGLAKDLSGK
jgi:hypothetical protein